MSAKDKAPHRPQPKVLAIDYCSSCIAALSEAGYSIQTGSFGRPYSVPPSDQLHPVDTQTTVDLSGFAEADIVILNTSALEATAPPPKMPGRGVESYWLRGQSGHIDPKPIMMAACSQAFDRTLKNGGIFIVNLADRRAAECFIGAEYAYRNRREVNSWGFLSVMSELAFQREQGEEIVFSDNKISRAVADGVLGAHFESVIAPRFKNTDYRPLATNKFGEDVACIIRHGKGFVLLLPQMPQMDKVIVRVFEEWAAQAAPSLFPHLGGENWIYQPAYDLPECMDLQAEAQRIRFEAESRITSIKSRVSELRKANADWYTLMTGTGDELVASVIRTLVEFGFKKVVDVDAEVAEQEGDGAMRREDVRIEDTSPILVVDIKGVQGHPEDAECQQAEKHALMRSRSLNRTDVRALTIINSQRGSPPLDRDQTAFREEMIQNAQQTESGLITTWDLHILLRNARRNKWPTSALRPIFYRSGRIRPIPEHYFQVGTIVNVWKKQNTFGVIPCRPISIGDRVAVVNGIDYVEFEVDSIMVDGTPCEHAETGSNCGIATDLASTFKKDLQVYLIIGVPTLRSAPCA